MGSTRFPLLTPHNYATWKIRTWSKMMEKSLIEYVDGTMVASSDPDKINEWNHNNKVAIGTLRKYVYEDPIFHIDNCKIVKEAWDKFASLYAKVDKARGFELDENIMSLDPKEFDIIQDYITKAHELRSMVKDCEITIEDEKLIYNLMRKLPPVYASFVLSFNTHKLTLGSSYTMPSFDSFTEILMVEQSTLMSTGILKSSKSKALVASKGNQGKGSNKKQNHGNKIHKKRNKTQSP